MRVRVSVVAATVVCVMSAPALAKPGHGPDGGDVLRSVQIWGPGIDGRVTLDGDARAARLLARHSGVVWVVQGRPKLAALRPPGWTGARGPGYDVLYRLTPRFARAYGLESSTIRQWLFPYARGGPWAYYPRSKDLPPEGWWPVSLALVPYFDELGLPPKDDRPAARGAEPATAEPSGGTPWLPGAIVVALAMAAMAFRRRGTLSPRT